MPEWVKWVFDGFGTEIIGFIMGAASGGLIGFRIGKRKSKFVQSQKAGSGSKQYQKGVTTSESTSGDKKTYDSKSVFRQTQKAGDDSKQTQIGEEKHV